MTYTKPNPGSDEAVAGGCTCPVLDNGHGTGYMGNPQMFWVSELCPMHGEEDDDDEDSGDQNGALPKSVDVSGV